MTKQNELERLEKIEKLIDECGADSYIAATFGDICAIARQNIANDWAVHPCEDMRDYYQRFLNVRAELEQERKERADERARAETLMDANGEHMAKCVELEQERDGLREALEAMHSDKTSTEKALHAELDEAREELAEARALLNVWKEMAAAYRERAARA